MTQILDGKFSFLTPCGMLTGVEELFFFLGDVSDRPLAKNKPVVVVVVDDATDRAV